MNWERIEGHWKQLKGKVREQLGRLTDDEIDVLEGRREQLSARIQLRRVAREDAGRRHDAWPSGTPDAGSH